MKNLFLFLSLFIISSSCLVNEPSPILEDQEYCSKAEERLQLLCSQNKENEYCCKVAKPTLKGKTFTQFCKEYMSKGVKINPKCLANVTACNQIDLCAK